MVEDGKISAQEALRLIQLLESPTVEGDVIQATTPIFGAGSERFDPREFEEIASRAQRLWQVILWVGVSIEVLSAFWLFTSVIASNYGFWFYCALAPFLIGLLLLALSTCIRTSHWLYVNVEQPHNEWPHNITLGLPLPIGLAGWFLRNFGNYIEGMNRAAIDEILEFLSTGYSSGEPLIVNVDEGHGGERVQVYIG
jgi:hypothetical protein